MKPAMVLAAFLLFIHSTFVLADTPGIPCADPHMQSKRSKELQRLKDADQADRGWQANLAAGKQPSPKALEQMSKNDLVRRKRVGEIFGEGCLKSAEDLEAAFIVFQHGTTADHYFQAFLWAQRAVSLGNLKLKGEVAMAIDRYLVSIGRRQLFGTQATQEKLGECFCIQPIEESFPQKLRDEYRGGKNAEYTGLSLLEKLNNSASHCPAAYCKMNLLPTPQGTVPGFW